MAKRMTNFRSAAIATGNVIDNSAYDNVKIVSDNISSVTNVSSAINSVLSVDQNINSINTVSGINAAISSIYSDKATLDSIFADKSKLDSLFNDKATLDSLYADKATLDSLFNDKATLDSLKADKTTLDRIYTSIASIDRIFTSIENIDVVFGSIANVDTVAGSITNVDNVGGSIDNVNAVAGGLADVNNYADTYYGTLATAPTIVTHPTLSQGNLYYDSVLNELRVYDSSVWKSAGSTINGTTKRQSFTATAGQTVFTVTGGYDSNYADVYLNGKKLLNGTDVDVSSGSNIVLSLGAVAGDIVDVVGYGAFVLADHYTKAEDDAKLALKADTTYVDTQDTALDNKITTNTNAINNIPIAVSKVASSVLLNTDSLALSNTLVTKNFADVTYTGNGGIQSITTGINSVDFTVANNGSGYWLDRTVNQVKNDAGTVVASGTTDWGTNKGVSKVLLKGRSVAYSSQVMDGLRGVYANISTNSTSAEGNYTTGLQSFNNTGVTIGSDAGINQSGATYILYQTLYTHISWGTTGQGKFYVEAYNPVTKEGMIYYIGSGSAGHKIPHSMGIALDSQIVKDLNDGAAHWTSLMLNTDKLCVSLTNAAETNVFNLIDKSTTTSMVVNGSVYVNVLNSEYISYYKCKSETFTIGTYTGTGVAGNKIVTKDVFGNVMKPARVIIKAISAVGSWWIYDNKRLFSNSLHLDDSSAEENFYPITVYGDGFDVGTDVRQNASGVQYLYMVEADTNASATPDGSYYNYPTAGSNLNLTASIFNYTDGKGSNGYNLTSESVTGSIDFTGVADGLHWVARDKLAGTYTTRTAKPIFDVTTGKFTGETNVLSFLKSPIMVTANTPQYIDYNQELIENTMDSLEVTKLKVSAGFDLGQIVQDKTTERVLNVTYTNTTNKPIFVYATANASAIVGFSYIVDGFTVYAGVASSAGFEVGYTFIVNAGSTYSINIAGGTLIKWLELR